MTTIYFVRHAESDLSIYDDLTRPLTEAGLQSSKSVTKFLLEQEIDHVFSSPFKRAIDTVKDFADQSQLSVEVIDDFRERKVSDEWIEDFNCFAKRQWEDFNYKLPNGDSLHDVQVRNVDALKALLRDYPEQKLVIGTHGTSLSVILNYFDQKYNYLFFNRIKSYMPFIVCLKFNGEELVSVEEFIV